MSMGHRGVWTAALDAARGVDRRRSARRIASASCSSTIEAEIAQPLTTEHALALAALAKAKPGTAGTRFAAALRAARQLVRGRTHG